MFSKDVERSVLRCTAATSSQFWAEGQMSTRSRPLPPYVKELRGLLFPAHPSLSDESIAQGLDSPVQDGDLVIASYPRSGTHWLQHIVQQILSAGEFEPEFVNQHKKPTGPGDFKHNHFPYGVLEWNPKARYLYAYRNPEDVVVSFYNLVQDVFKVPLDKDEFFEDFLAGTVPYGSCLQHVRSYVQHALQPNLLMVSFEKLSEDKNFEILRIAEFLGTDHHRKLLSDDSALQKVIEKTHFDSMKKLPADPAHHQGARLVRRGVVGGGADFLTRPQLQRLRSEAESVLQGTQVLQEWRTRWK